MVILLEIHRGEDISLRVVSSWVILSAFTAAGAIPYVLKRVDGCLEVVFRASPLSFNPFSCSTFQIDNSGITI